MKDGRRPKSKVLFTVFKVTTGYSRYLLPCRQSFSVLKKSLAGEYEDQFWSFVAIYFEYQTAYGKIPICILVPHYGEPYERSWGSPYQLAV